MLANIEEMNKKYLLNRDPRKYCFIARSKHGKTVLALELLGGLIEEKHVEPARVLMFSSTVHSDPAQLKFRQQFDIPKQNVAENIDIERMI